MKALCNLGQTKVRALGVDWRKWSQAKDPVRQQFLTRGWRPQKPHISDDL